MSHTKNRTYFGYQITDEGDAVDKQGNKLGKDIYTDRRGFSPAFSRFGQQCLTALVHKVDDYTRDFQRRWREDPGIGQGPGNYEIKRRPNSSVDNS